jgi:DNA repair protein RecO (recombination protein O)
MLLAEGRNLDVVTQFQRLSDPRALAGDVQRAAAAALVVEVADKVLEERHPQLELYALVVDTLGHLGVNGSEPRKEAVFFLTAVLAELGYAPELERCAQCGGTLDAEGLGFSPLAGGVVCASCAALPPPASAISARTIKILRVAAALDRDLFFRLHIDAEDLVALESALEPQLEHHLDRQLKSLDFARRVRR